MINLMEEIRQQVRNTVDTSLKKSIKNGELPELEVTGIAVESPKENVPSILNITAPEKM